MLELEYPWLLILLPLPLLAFALLPVARQTQLALRVPFFAQLSHGAAERARSWRGHWLRRLLLALGWLSLLLAASNPVWVGAPVSLPSSGRELMLAVDLSESMLMEDMVLQGERVNRLIAVKAVLAEFVKRRSGDRLGLIFFGDQAYMQSPLTFDRHTVQRFLLEAQIGFAGSATAIGDAIGLGIKRLRQREGDRHVLVLLTDGANTAGEVKPLAAAKMAAENGIVIYTVGVGADEMIAPGLFGTSFGARRLNPSADLDEKTLREIADLSGGRYFRARNPEELLGIYQLLDQLEPVEGDEKTFRPRQTLFYWPLGFALLLSAVLALSQLLRLPDLLARAVDTGRGGA